MNFLDIPDKDKIKLGKLINYYRVNDYKANNPTSWSIKEFVKYHDYTICSPTTFTIMKESMVIKNNDIYDELLEKLGKYYNYEKDFRIIHKMFENKIIAFFENYHDTLLKP